MPQIQIDIVVEYAARENTAVINLISISSD